MADTLYADVSYYQPVVNDSYPYAFFCFRANDGTFRDPHFFQNLAWAKAAVKSGKLKGFIVYTVFEENWIETYNTLVDMIGPHPDNAMAIMIDVESWEGKISGNHSADLNQFRERLITYLNHSRRKSRRKSLLARDRKRVMAYANQSDRDSLWPSWGDAKWDIANISYNPNLRDQIAHQFSWTWNTPPFGPCDINSADGRTPREFAVALGIKGKAHRKPPAFPLKPLKHYAMDEYNGTRSAKHNAEIAVLQKHLIKAGYAGKVNPDKWADGKFGPATRDAVNRFKKKMKWRQNGKVGRRAWNKIVRM